MKLFWRTSCFFQKGQSSGVANAVRVCTQYAQKMCVRAQHSLLLGNYAVIDLYANYRCVYVCTGIQRLHFRRQRYNLLQWSENLVQNAWDWDCWIHGQSNMMWPLGQVYGRQMWQIAAELLSHVAIGARNNAIKSSPGHRSTIYGPGLQWRM